MLGRNRGSAGSSRNVDVKLFSQTDLRFVLTSIELRPMNNSPVITRFAPSPTGFLHIGGARTALFNWLFAKASQGKFLLRIEDTDRERSTEEAEAAIIEGLQWLGLDWDGDAMSQHSRQRRHIEAARELLKLGAAYKCYSTPAEIENAKKEAKEAGCPTLFQSPWRNAGTAAAPDAPFTIRLKTPVEGQTEIRDSVYGKLSWKNETIEDLVILRSDGSPTYNLAVVVDDHDMGITHVIRGDDHLANSPKQHLIYKSFGWKTPEFAHVPLIYGEDGKKLSKRGGAVGVEYYRAAGIIPEAMRNYLCRLGWSHGDKDFFATEQAIDWFSLEDLRKSPARLDSKKMMNVCGRHIAVADDSTLLTQLNVYLKANDRQPVPEPLEPQLRAAMPFLKQRARSLAQIADNAHFLLGDAPFVPADEIAELFDKDSICLLREFKNRAASAEWSRDSLQHIASELASEKDLKLGPVTKPIRLALTGRSASPSVFDIMEVIGRSETLTRFKRVLQNA